MTYEEAMQKISSLLRFGMKPGLERIEKLLALLGNPQNKLRFVHVAGTNGKGSTCALIASVLTRAGYVTGRYTSPFVVEFCERMQVDGEMIPHEDLVRLVEQTFPLVEQMAQQGEEITEFEFITALAFQWFAEQKCDIVVLEVGLGGRLDATNVITSPIVTVITSISLDHTAILGDTVEQIAYEKAGIIKEYGVTISSPNQPEGALKVISDVAFQRHNKFIVADIEAIHPMNMGIGGTMLAYNGAFLQLPLLGKHQLSNAITALTVFKVLNTKGFRISKRNVSIGFKKARMPARLEVLSASPLVILDGAHNPGGTQALAEAIQVYCKGKKVTGVMGMLADKDVDTAIQNLNGLFSRVVTLTPSNPRAMPAEELAEKWKEAGAPAVAMQDGREALREVFATLDPHSAAVICGSLYLAGDLRPAALELLAPEKAGTPEKESRAKKSSL